MIVWNGKDELGGVIKNENGRGMVGWRWCGMLEISSKAITVSVYQSRQLWIMEEGWNG